MVLFALVRSLLFIIDDDLDSIVQCNVPREWSQRYVDDARDGFREDLDGRIRGEPHGPTRPRDDAVPTRRDRRSQCRRDRGADPSCLMGTVVPRMWYATIRYGIWVTIATIIVIIIIIIFGALRMRRQNGGLIGYRIAPVCQSPRMYQRMHQSVHGTSWHAVRRTIVAYRMNADDNFHLRDKLIGTGPSRRDPGHCVGWWMRVAVVVGVGCVGAISTVLKAMGIPVVRCFRDDGLTRSQHILPGRETTGMIAVIGSSGGSGRGSTVLW